MSKPRKVKVRGCHFPSPVSVAIRNEEQEIKKAEELEREKRRRFDSLILRAKEDYISVQVLDS